MEDNNLQQDIVNSDNGLPTAEPISPEVQQLDSISDQLITSAPQKPKKKRFNLLFIVILVLIVLTSGTVTAYAFKSNIVNTFVKMTNSPKEYYAYVEKKGIKDSLNKYSQVSSSKNMAVKMNTDVNFDRKSINSLLQSSMNMNLDSLEQQLGVSVESFGLKMLYGKNDNITNETLGLRFNKVDVISMDYFIDSSNGNLLLRIPELSKAYLDLTDKTNASKVKMPSEAETRKFLNRYSNLIVDSITKVTLQNNYSYKENSLSQKCTKLTVVLTNEDAIKIINSILDNAKEDDYIINLLPMYHMTKNDYQSMIESAKADIKKDSSKLLNKDMTMVVYVDASGKIIGRDLSTKDSKASFGYGLLSKKAKEEYNITIKDEQGRKVVDVIGSHTKKKGVYNGAATINVTDTSKADSKTIKLDLKYQDVKSDTVDGKTYQYGTFNLSSLDLMGLQINSEFSVKDGIQNNKTSFNLGATKLVTLDSTVEYVKDFKPEMPGKDAETYSIKDITKYASTINYADFISNLSKKLGFDVQSIINRFMLGANPAANAGGIGNSTTSWQ